MLAGIKELFRFIKMTSVCEVDILSGADDELVPLVFQLVYPQDVKLTEKEVSLIELEHLDQMNNQSIDCECIDRVSVLFVVRKAASATCRSRTRTQVTSVWMMPCETAGATRSSPVFLHFPGCLGDTQFSFRLRQSVGRRAPRLREDVYNRDAPVTLQVRKTYWSVIDRLRSFSPIIKVVSCQRSQSL